MPNDNEKLQENIIDLAKFRDTVLRNQNYSSLEKVILLDLVFYAGTIGEAFPSQGTLAKNHGITDRHVRNILQSLKNKGDVPGWRQRGYSMSNKYQLNKRIYKQEIRNSGSSQAGNQIPTQVGSGFPPTISQEFNHLSTDDTSYKELTRKIEDFNGKPLNEKDMSILKELARAYGVVLVGSTLSLALSRNLKYIKPLYLKKILQDERNSSTLFKREPFVPCGIAGCSKGYIFDSKQNTARKCSCLLEYESAICKDAD